MSHRHDFLGLALALGAATVLSACSGAEEAAESMPESAPAAAEPAMSAELPELTADGVWAHLTADNDYTSWPLWPGKAEQYTGGDPHGALLTTYVNDLALGAVEDGLGAVPVGGIVVKNNFNPEGVLMATTVMVKTADFNPDHNNWWFLKRNADGSVDAAGQGVGCQNCHIGAAANDYIFTSSLSAAGQD